MMSVLRGHRIRLHNRIGAAIDWLFPPYDGYEDDKSYWETFWNERFTNVERSQQIFEHDVAGKRWLYERVIDAVETWAGRPLSGLVVAEFGAVGSPGTELEFAL